MSEASDIDNEAESDLVPAGLGRRVAARVIDLPIALPVAIMCGTAVGVVGLMAVWSGDSSNEASWTALIALAFATPLVLYEVLWIKRRGSTTGKRLTGVRIVRWPDGGPVSAGRALGRYAILHSGTAAGVLVAAQMPNDTSVWAWLAVAAAWWPLVGLSPLLDRQQRGWHDKAAGTIAIAHEPPSARRVAIRTAVVAAIIVGIPGAITASILAERNEREQRRNAPVDVEGPGDDACKIRRGTLSCDLVSIDTVWRPDGFEISSQHHDRVYLGRGSLCAVSSDRVVSCWEWDAQTAPRLALSPGGITMSEIVGTEHIVCGHHYSEHQFVCWTVGTDQPYREFRHVLPHREFELLDIDFGSSDDTPKLIFWELKTLEQRIENRNPIPHSVDALSYTHIISRR